MTLGVRAMFDLTLNDRLFLSFSVALGFIVAGTGNALFGPRTWWTRAAIAVVGLSTAILSASVFIPGYAAPLAGVGAGILTLSSLARTSAVRRIVAQLRQPRLAWSAVAVGGVAWMAAEFLRFDALENSLADAQIAQLHAIAEVNPYVADESRLAKTDRGSSIHMMTVAEEKSVEQLAAIESQTMQSALYQDYIIRRGPPDDSSNCHGWVFTGGKYAILGHEVDTIVAENDYSPMTAPHPGDLCLYRSDAGAVAHSAIVRSVLDDGTVLVEGKWGRFGVFLHPVAKSCYGENFSYYHSPRSTHVLNSIP